MKQFPFAVVVYAALCAARAESQTFTTLVDFTDEGTATSGLYPRGSLTLAGTTLFGMTSEGNTNGTLFSVGVDGSNFQNLVSFTGTGGTASGYFPEGNLTLADSTLYGMTDNGGAKGWGNVFSVGTNGTSYQNLLSFTGTGGAAAGEFPSGSLTIAGSTLFGMTSSGGAGLSGNAFSVGINGANYQNLGFVGRFPAGSLTLSGTTLYGMADYGGGSGIGNVFSVGTNGTNYQNLLSFTGTSGAASGGYPLGSLTLVGTRLFGMTRQGGANGDGNIFSVGEDGTNYQDLVSFTGSGSGGSANGSYPVASLTLSGTLLFGMTQFGGINGYGNIFSVGIDGSDYQDLYSFAAGSDGAYPQGDLTSSGGTLFGMTSQGPGAGDGGTVFALVLPTPEPGTLALVGTAAVALVSYRWRRMRSRRKCAGVPASAGRTLTKS